MGFFGCSGDRSKIRSRRPPGPKNRSGHFARGSPATFASMPRRLRGQDGQGEAPVPVQDRSKQPTPRQALDEIAPPFRSCQGSHRRRNDRAEVIVEVDEAVADRPGHEAAIPESNPAEWLEV